MKTSLILISMLFSVIMLSACEEGVLVEGVAATRGLGTYECREFGWRYRTVQCTYW